MTPRRATHSLVLLSAVLFAGACSTASRITICEITEPLSGELDEIQEVADLQESLALVLEAHCKCEFSPEVQARIPLGVKGVGWSGTDPAPCLGPIRIVHWTVEGDGLLAIEIVRKGASPRRRTNLYVIFAHFVEGRWLYSWPAGTGPPLHP